MFADVCMCDYCRSLGVHVSKVRSITLDSWEPELLKVMTELGNARVNQIFEAVVSDDYTRPVHSSLRSQHTPCLCLVEFFVVTRSDGQISNQISHSTLNSLKKRFKLFSQIWNPHFSSDLNSFKDISQIKSQICYGNVRFVIEKSTQRYSMHLIVIVTITHKLNSQSLSAVQHCIVYKW